MRLPSQPLMAASLRRQRRRQMLAVGLAGGVLAGLVVLHVLRPSPEERQAASLRDRLIAGGERNLPEDERQAFREEWERLSPATRKSIVTEVCRHRLEEMRRENVRLTPDERAERVRQAVDEMRRQRREISPAERAELKARLAAGETREMVRHILELYQTEFTARERAELDPLVHEWINQLEWEMR